MTFQSLLVSKDDQASDVLTPVLAGFGLGVQCCGYPDALCRLTEQKFDAVIVDYDDPHSAALVLQNACQSSAGHNPVTVALLGDKTRSATFLARAQISFSTNRLPSNRLKPVCAPPLL